MKLCRDCAHFKSATCTRTATETVELIYGLTRRRGARDCDKERMPGLLARALGLDRCGLAARYFIGREVAQDACVTPLSDAAYPEQAPIGSRGAFNS